MKKHPNMDGALGNRKRHLAAFSLVELLLSMTVLTVLMVLIVQVVSQTSQVWKASTGRADQFREARDAFEAITRNLAQATLNTYYEYFDEKGNRRTMANSGTFKPDRYGRYSELRFKSGDASELLASSSNLFPTHAVFFQAPLGFNDKPENHGLDHLLNTWGYYVEFREDTDRPSFVPGPTRRRFRLMEFMQPSEELNIFNAPEQWLVDAVADKRSHVLASNIVALVILPKLPSKGMLTDPTVDPDGNKLSPYYAYDSHTEGNVGMGPEYNSLHQLPPIVEVTMVAIDEASASILEMKHGANAPDFGLSSLFKDSRPESREEDLETLTKNLSEQGVSYRVFSTEVSLRGAKWSRNQDAMLTVAP